MTIDAHTHFFPRVAMLPTPCEWAKLRGEEQWLKLCADRPNGTKTLQGFPSLEKFLADMAKAEVDRAVIQGWYWQNAKTCEEYNEILLSSTRTAPKNVLKICASIQPADLDFTLKTISQARQKGFSGIGELHDGVQGFSYRSADFEKIAEAAAKAGLALCLHITENSAAEYYGKFDTDTDGAFALALAHPKTNFIFAHWAGGEFFKDKLWVTKKAKNIFFDSAATPLIYRHDARVWSRAAEIDAVRRCALYGSDYPLRLYPKKGSTEEMVNIVSEASKNFVSQTAQEFFSLRAEKLFV